MTQSSEELLPAPDESSEPRIIPTSDIDPGVLDQDALRVISRLVRHGQQAYLVGGCVRDLLVGRIPKDFDVATDAHPRQIKRLFRNGRIIGRRFRLVHIYYGKNIVETATFRREPSQTAGDDEEDLLITEDNEYGSAGEDARRRDFTVNGLFLDPTHERIIDYVGGLVDLEARLLRTIGDPMVRMAEDPVRILRAIKFATRLDFRIEDGTWKAMCALAPELSRAAPPRVLEEILRLLRSGTALGAFRMMRACGALGVILPEVESYLSSGESEHAQAADRTEIYWRLLEALDAEVHNKSLPSTALCIALLFLPIIEGESERRSQKEDGPAADLTQISSEYLGEIGRATRLSRRDASRARRIILSQRRFIQPASRRFRLLFFLRSEDFPDALELFRLRCAARGQGWDIYEGWLARYQRALVAPQEELETERRRARRRPRNRRRGGKGGAAHGNHSEES